MNSVAAHPITTPRLRLVPWTRSDGPALRRLLQDREVRRFLGGPVPDDELGDRLEHELAGRHPGSFAVRDRLGDAVVGWVTADVHGDDVELSWQLVPGRVGHGLATEAARPLRDLAFVDTPADRVVADTREANQRSRRVAERLGLRLEGSFQHLEQPQVRYVASRDEARVAPGPDVLQAPLLAWAQGTPEVRAVALVGSWARGAAGTASDVDVVVVADPPTRLLQGDRWIGEVGPWYWWRHEPYGRVTSRRVGHVDGQVEYTIVDRWWATPPIDPATARVVRDGLHPLHDPDGLLRGARAWVRTHG